MIQILTDREGEEDNLKGLIAEGAAALEEREHEEVAGSEAGGFRRVASFLGWSSHVARSEREAYGGI
jgi:hypothetical protein